MRLFVGIELPDEVKAPVLKRRSDIANAISRQGVRFVSPEKLHVTLRFLGDVPEEQLMSLKEELRLIEFNQFQLSLGSIGAFPSLERPKVAWLGVVSPTDDLNALYCKVRDATNRFAESPSEDVYIPHMTLARIVPGSKEVGRILRNLQSDSGEVTWTVKSFVLFLSQATGSYEVLERVEASLDPSR